MPVTVAPSPKAKSSASSPSRANGAKSNGHGSNGAANREVLSALRALGRGDFAFGEHHEPDLAEAFNDVATLNARLVRELQRISQTVGRDGRLAQRVSVSGAVGDWSVAIDSVNELISDLAHPIIETGRVLASVARGDLSQQVTLEIDGRPLKGEFLRAAARDRRHGRQARRIRIRSHARRSRSRLRRKTRGQRAGAQHHRYVEEPYRLGELDGRYAYQPDS